MQLSKTVPTTEYVVICGLGFQVSSEFISQVSKSKYNCEK